MLWEQLLQKCWKKLMTWNFLLRYVLKLMLPHLSTLSKIFQSGELVLFQNKTSYWKNNSQNKRFSWKTEAPLWTQTGPYISPYYLWEGTLGWKWATSETINRKICWINCNIHACFPYEDNKDILSVLESFPICNVGNFHSSSDSEEFKVYGDESIHILKDHYQDDKNTARYQWDNFHF